VQFYPPISQLIGREALPADIGILASAGDTVQTVLDKLLAGIRFKNLVINQSAFGDVRFYSLTIVRKEVSFKLPGTEIAFLLFPGTDGSDISIAFEWRWGVKRYVNDFETALFTRSLADFFDLLLKVANISEAQFIDGIVRVFVGDPNPYVKLVQDIRTYVADYKNRTVKLEDASGEIFAKAGEILTELGALIADLQNPAPAFDSAVDYIVDRFENIATTLDIDLDVIQLAFDTVTRDVTDTDEKLEQLRILFGSWFGGLTWQDLEELLVPQFSLAVTQVPMALEFPRKWLVPLKADHTPNPDDKVKSQLTFTAGTIQYSTRTGLTFGGETGFGFTKSMIGKTGLTIDVEGGKIDFSRTTNIPEADAAGYPTDFVGVFVKYVEIGLPEKWFAKYQAAPGNRVTLAVVGRALLIGTGGLSGTIGLEALDVSGKPDPDGALPTQGAKLEFILGKHSPSTDPPKGFKLGFSQFDMKFRQGVLLETNIKGSLTIPKFEADPPSDPPVPPEIDIELHIAQDGDFDVTATVPGAGYPLAVPGVFTFIVKMLSVGKDGTRVFIRTAGDLSFAENGFLKTFITEPIHIEKLCIYSDGSFEIEGGTIPVPESCTISVGPAKIAITAIHCGAHEQDHGGVMRKYRFWGFDGGISVNPGGIDACGDGIKYYYTVDDANDPDHKHHSFLRIEGIGIDFVIPGNVPKEKAALLLQGYLSLKDPVYEGSLAIQLPQLKIFGGASMSYDTSIPAWLVRADLELPTPLPLGTTSLGIYSFSGLFGLRYVAAKEAAWPPPATVPPDASWGDYYREPPRGVKFLTPDKTAGASNPFSIGAGVGLCTIPDDTVFSAQLFLLVSIPNLILLEGHGDVLAKQRVSPADEPPYYAYLALSPDSIEIGAGAHYMVPKDTGRALDLHATLEAAFFFRNPRAWYVNFGTKAKPTTARVISLFDAYAYLMLSASGIEAGTGVHYDFAKHYGPVSVSAHAYLDLWIYLSFERPQAGGGIALGGYVDVKLIGVGFHIEIAAGLTAEVPKPFRVAGFVEVCVSVNLKIKKISKCVHVEFVWDKDSTVDVSPVDVLRISTTAAPPAAGIHMASGRNYEVLVTPDAKDIQFINANTTPIPLDTYIDIKFAKPVDPTGVSRIAGFDNPPDGNVETIPPQFGTRIVTHSYRLQSLSLEIHAGSGWVTYDPFVALAPGALLDANDAPSLSSFPIGAWQKQDKTYSQIRLLAPTPFTYMEPVGGYRPEEMGLTAATIFCAGAPRTETCVKWDSAGKDVTEIFTAGVNYYRNGLLYRIEGEDARTLAVHVTRPPRDMLAIKPGSRAILQFPQSVVRCRLAFISGAPAVTLRFQRRKSLVPQTGSSVPTQASATQIPYARPEYIDVKTLVAGFDTLDNPIIYDDPVGPIDRVIVEPPAPDALAIAALNEKIELRRDDAVQRDIDALQKQLQAVRAKSCLGIAGGTAPVVPKEWDCATFLYEVCWLTAADSQFNQTIPGQAAVEADFQNMVAAVKKTIAPIWQPNRLFRVVLTVSDTVTGPRGVIKLPGTPYYVQFRTAGPLGYFGQDPPLAPGAVDDGRREIAERQLKFYIDMERSDPDPSGNLLYAKPLYYAAPVLRLFLAKPYAYHFFAEWPRYPTAAQPAPDHYEMLIRVKDPAESESTTDPLQHDAPLQTAAITGTQSWITDPAPRRTEDLTVLSSMRNPLLNVRNPHLPGVDPGPTCWTVGGDPIKPAAKGMQVKLQDLKPNKLYTAVVLNRHAEAGGVFREAEVHRYPFKTSIYPDFASHIASYHLTDDTGNTRPAVFLVSHALPGAIAAPQIYATARAIIQRNSAADSAAFPDFFDRLINACLKLAPLPPALSLEFNFVRNALTQEIYGLWIRSREPLNYPRIPPDTLRSAIHLYIGGVEQPTALVLFSKDCCQAFVMTAAGLFPSQAVAFGFDHLIWGGKGYIIDATVVTDPFSAP
jgi:hypothetical protein